MPDSTSRGNGRRAPLPPTHGPARGATTPDAGPPERVGFGQLIEVARRHLPLIAGATALTLTASVVLVRTEEPVYRATAVLRLADSRRAMTSGLEHVEVDRDKWRLSNPLLSQIQLLRSRHIAGLVVDSIGLRLRPEFDGFSAKLLADVRVDDSTSVGSMRLRFTETEVFARVAGAEGRARYGAPLAVGGVRVIVSGRPKADTANWSLISREAAIDLLLQNLVVTSRPMTDIVDVSYTAHRPTVARRVVNSVVAAYQASDARAAREQSRRRRIFLAEQLAQTDSLHAAAQLALSRFRSRERVFSSRDKLTAQQRDLTTLEVRRAELDADRRMYAVFLADLERPGTARTERLRAIASTPELGGNPVLAELFRQLVRHQTALDSLTTGEWRRAAQSPDVTRTRDLVATTEQRLVDAVRSHLASLEARVAALDELHERSVVAIQRLPEAEAEEVRLLQQVETIREMGDELRAEYQRSRITEAVETGQVEIVDLAALPGQPVPSLRGLKLGLGLLVGLMLGGGGAFLRELTNTSIRQRDEIERLLHVPNLAVIPEVLAPAGPADPSGRRRWRLPALAQYLPLGRSPGRRPGLAEQLVTLSDAPSAASEAYRTLRTNLLFSSQMRAGRVMVVTSAAPAEGKTLTAANLAVAFAREGLRVLLVDCDRRRGRLHRIFQVARGPGFAQLVAGQAFAPDLVQSTSVNGLFLVPRGTSHAEAGDELRGARMGEVLSSFSHLFHVVILDTPPVLAVTDASILSGLADMVLFVVRAGRTGRGEVQRAMARLSVVHARVVGAVLNDPGGEIQHPEHVYYAGYAQQ